MEMQLFEKTEIFVNNIRLDHVNLNRVAGAVAGALQLNSNDVAVVDVREKTLTMDI